MYWNDPSLYGTTFANREFAPQQFPFQAQQMPFPAQHFPLQTQQFPIHAQQFPYFQAYAHPWMMSQHRSAQPPVIPFDRPFLPIDTRFAIPGFEHNMLPQFQNFYANLPYYNYNTFRPFY